MSFVNQSFERQGLGIDKWLLRLVSQNTETRVYASQTLLSIMSGIEPLDSPPPGDSTTCSPINVDERRLSFQLEIRNCLDQKAFPTELFLKQLAELNEHCRKAAKPGDWTGLMIHHIAVSLGHHWRANPHWMLDMLKGSQRHTAYECLIGLGRDGHQWLPALKRQLVSPTASLPYFSNPLFRSIAAVGAHDPTLQPWLLNQFESSNNNIALSAASTLGHLGVRSDTVLHELITRFFQSNETFYASLLPLVALGKHERYIRLFVIELAKPCLTVPTKKFPQSLSFRAFAIDTLGELGDNFDEFPDVLLDALESFEEYDPDLTYEGPHGRVSSAIEKVGSRAGSIAVPFAKHLIDAIETGDYARSMIDALVAMGSAARPALPEMQRYRELIAEPEDLPLPAVGPASIDEFDDPVGHAMTIIHNSVS